MNLQGLPDVAGGTSAMAAPVAKAAVTQDRMLATTTTKAYNVTIAVPKIHRCYIPVEEEMTDTNSLVGTETTSLASTTPAARPARSRANTADSLRGVAAKAMAMIYNDASSNQSDVHPFFRDTPNPDNDTTAVIPVEIEGCDETGGVVVKLDNKPTSQQNNDMDTSEGSSRSHKLSRRDRYEAPMMPDAEEQTGSVVSAKQSDGSTTPPPPLANGTPNHSGTEEIIGYVQGEDTPKKKGHKKTSSNIPVLGHKKTASNIPIKDIITAEEMAAVVKIVPKTETQPNDHFPLLQNDGPLRTVFGTTTTTNNNGSCSSIHVPDTPERPRRRVSYLTRDAAIAAIKRNGSWSQEFAATGSPPQTRTAVDVPGTIVELQRPTATGPPEPNTEIKVSVLTELALKNLLEEGHLLHRPVSIPVTSSVNDDTDQTEWVEFTILAKDPSIGIILERLERIGVGSSVGTVTIFKAELCRTAFMAKDSEEDATATGSGMDVSGKTNGTAGPGNINDATITAARNEWRNAASRLRVEQVKEQIHEQAELSFDYVSLLVIASLLAGIGLITDSTVVIVASMLVSPIMGPVMGMTFGSRVYDWELAKFSLHNEFISLLVSVFIGVLIAVGSFWSTSAEEWPTEEMSLRGTTVGLITGVAIAIPSGMGVALSILGNNTSSLVGVAISASLLPPAVNAGICWAYAFFLRVNAAENANEGDYDFAMTGLISFALTLVNILCIWFAGIFMFAVKEVAPSQSKSAFWENDIKVARAIKKGNKKIDLNVIRAGLEDALSKQERAKQGKVLPERRLSARQRSTLTNRKHRHHHHHHHRRSTSPSVVDFNIHSTPSLDESVFEEVMDDAVEPSPLFDDVKHMGLSEMATLLGFDRDADAFIEENSQDIENERGSSAWFHFCSSSKTTGATAAARLRRPSKFNAKVGRLLMVFVFGNLFVAVDSFSFAQLTKRQQYGSAGDAQASPVAFGRNRTNNLNLHQALNSADEEASSDVAEETELTALITSHEDGNDSSKGADNRTGQRILELAIPALGALLIDPLLTLADTAFVGRFAQSPFELAGMGSATALLTFSFYIFNFLCTATTPLVASKRSSGKENEAIAVCGQALSLALALGGILAIVLIALRYPLLNLMGITISGEEATGYAADFLIIRALAAPAVFSISASTGILRGYLDTKTPIFVLLVANIVNFLLDVVLIVMLGMGPAGAALATTTAEWISALLFLFVLAGRLPSADGELGKKEENTIVVTPSLAIPPWEEVKPLAVASSSVFLRTTILQLFLSCSAAFAARGTSMEGGAASSIAAHQIAIQLWMLCSYTSDALAAASQGLVADAIGRDNSAAVKDVSKTVLVYSTGLGSILAGFLWLGFTTSFLLNLFTSDQSTQADLLDIAALLIFSQPLNSVVFAADGILQGASEFPYQAKSMALSAFVAGSFFCILQSMHLTDELFCVWSALICLQLMRGLTSAYKIIEDKGPIRILES